VLVLQVEDGKETVSGGVSPMLIVQFITVQATFKPTVLALPLQVLSTLPGPITRRVNAELTSHSVAVRQLLAP